MVRIGYGRRDQSTERSKGDTVGCSGNREQLRHEWHQRHSGDVSSAPRVFKPCPWSKKELEVNETALERKILPTFSLIRTDRHLYGFRGVNGLWLEEALGMREKVTHFHSNDYGAVFITNERLVGFSPLLGGFSSKPLDVHERIVGVENDHGLILVSTTKRTLVFGSRLSGWEEFE